MTKQVAVKLPDGLVEQLDQLVQTGVFDSRSQAIRSGLEAIVAARHRDGIDRSYRDVFARIPDTPGEIADATRLAVAAIHEEPWERWWGEESCGGARRRTRRAARFSSSVAARPTT